ncbi:hypothetical protein CLU83_3555 [Flavobacterium sp. 1]|nr:hypothetical protein CLU83_3555 [Flavobacterium sp. 1]
MTKIALKVLDISPGFEPNLYLIFRKIKHKKTLNCFKGYESRPDSNYIFN